MSLIHEWNPKPQMVRPRVSVNDETLRDGLQAPAISDPSIEDKLQILHAMEEVGIHSVNIGLPGASPRATDHSNHLAREIRDARLHIKPNCAARTVISDIRPLVELSQRMGYPIMASIFIGSSAARRSVEGWTLNHLMQRTKEAVDFAVREGLEVMFITEDTTRAEPSTIASLFRVAVDAGATRVCICDTVGYAEPAGVQAIVGFVRELLGEWQMEVAIDWHGHNDRGLALVNALSAVAAGVDQVHGCALGIGERTGNTAIEQVLTNLILMGYSMGDVQLAALPNYVSKVSAAMGVPIPANMPMIGADAFTTQTGVHAAAVLKALAKGDTSLADLVYSAVPASALGRAQTIALGPMSGRSNVRYCLRLAGIDPTPETVERLFQAAKNSSTVLSLEQIAALARSE